MALPKTAALDPAAVLPVQWADMSRSQSQRWSGEHRLQLALLDDARRTLSHAQPKAGKPADDWSDTRDWVLSNDARYFSFVGICAELGLDREHARAVLLSGKAKRVKISHRRANRIAAPQWRE